MVFLVVLVFLLIIAVEVPGLVRSKMWRELAAFGVLLFVGLAISIPQALGMPVPSPNKPIEMIFKPFADWIMPR